MTTPLAVVSGGGTWIGAAAAGALAEDGYDVLLIGERADLLRAVAERIGAQCGKPVSVDAVVADLTDPAEAARVVEAVADRTVDLLVHNAGADLASDPTSPPRIAGHWRANFDTSVLTAVLLIEALRPTLRRPGGRIILLSSIHTARAGGGPVAVAQAALRGWAAGLARDFSPERITVNVVSPGYAADTAFSDGQLAREPHAQRQVGTMAGRAGKPPDIATLIRYLASPDASYLTGQVLEVAGNSVPEH